jgi:hypothetical protein
MQLKPLRYLTCVVFAFVLALPGMGCGGPENVPPPSAEEAKKTPPIEVPGELPSSKGPTSGTQ